MFSTDIPGGSKASSARMSRGRRRDGGCWDVQIGPVFGAPGWQARLAPGSSARRWGNGGRTSTTVVPMMNFESFWKNIFLRSFPICVFAGACSAVSGGRQRGGAAVDRSCGNVARPRRSAVGCSPRIFPPTRWARRGPRRRQAGSTSTGTRCTCPRARPMLSWSVRRVPISRPPDAPPSRASSPRPRQSKPRKRCVRQLRHHFRLTLITHVTAPPTRRAVCSTWHPCGF